MTNEQKLREIIEKYDEQPYSDISGCVSDLTALIEEHYYPKEFVEWYLTEASNDRRRIYPYCYMIWVNGEGIGFDTFDELFNYWKENER